MKKESPKLYPLTAAQRMHFYTLKFCPKKQVLNIGMSLTIGGDIIDFDTLRTAIGQAIERCESIRLRFCEGENGELLQYVVPEETQETEYFDFTGWTFDDAEDELRRWTATPFERCNSPMYRIVMMLMPDGFKGLYINVDHMILDSSGIICFLKDLIELYCHMKYDYKAPKPLASYIEVLEQDLKYENESGQYQRDRAFWKDFIERSEPVFCDISGDARLRQQRIDTGNPGQRSCKVTSESVEARHQEFHLEGDPAKRIMDFCLEHRVPIVCLMLLGLRTFLSKMNNSEPDVSIKSTVSRRGNIQKKKCGGTRVHFFPCRTIIPPTVTFMEALHMVQRSQFEIFRHADFDPIEFVRMNAQYYHNAPGQAYECMSLTYQPMSMAADTTALKDLQYKAKWYTNGAAASPLYLTIMHNSIDHGLDFYFEYQLGRVSFKDLEYLYYYLCKIIFMGLDNPDITIGEILRTV